MIKVKFTFKRKGDNENFPSPDEASVTSLETAEEEIKQIIKEFNEVELQRYGDEKSCREFVCLFTDEPIPQHEWHKIESFSASLTHYRCDKCRIVKGYYFPAVPVGGDCYPERVCIHCNQEFASEKNLQKHQIRKHGLTKEEK